MEKQTVFQKFIAVLCTAFLAVCLSASGLMCLITAFKLSVRTDLLLGGLAAVALVTASLFRLRKGWIPMLCLWVLALAFVGFYRRPELLQGVFALVLRLGKLYGNAYGLQVPTLPADPWDDCTLPLVLWGSAVTWLAVWALERRQSLLPPLLFGSIPLGLCLVVVDTPPQLGWLLMFVATLVMLILTQSSRRLNPADGRRLVALLLVPVLLLVLGLNLLLPVKGYERGGLGQQVLHALVQLSSRVFPLDVNSMGALDVRVPVATTEDLNIGPRQNSNQVAMEIKGNQSGVVYLRGMTYGVYTGDSWKLIPKADYEEVYALYSGFYPAAGLTIRNGRDDASSINTVTVRPRSRELVMYTPQYLQGIPQGGTAYMDAYVENAQGVRDYELLYYADVADSGFYGRGNDFSEFADSGSSSYDYLVANYYTRLPEDTKKAARELLEQQWWFQENWTTPQQIAAWISSTAVYDLETEKMPAGADFAMWFLTESDTGYCVHFASAAVVMLRAANIPARYVTGYLAKTEAGQWVKVTKESAHAWCEYYMPGIGWVPLEATPPDGVAMTAEPDSQTEPTEDTTAPPETTAPTETRETESTEESTDPTASHSSKEPEQNQGPSKQDNGPRKLPAAVWWVLGIGLVVLLFLLRRPLVLGLRKSGRHRLPPKRRFLRRWQADCRMARHLKQPVRLEYLAEKAFFSRHDPAQEDLALLYAWEQELETALQAAPWLRRFYLRWILILI